MFPSSFHARSCTTAQWRRTCLFPKPSESGAPGKHCRLVKVRLEEDTPTGTVRAERRCEAAQLDLELCLAWPVDRREFWALWSNDILFCWGTCSAIKLCSYQHQWMMPESSAYYTDHSLNGPVLASLLDLWAFFCSSSLIRTFEFSSHIWYFGISDILCTRWCYFNSYSLWADTFQGSFWDVILVHELVKTHHRSCNDLMGLNRSFFL